MKKPMSSATTKRCIAVRLDNLSHSGSPNLYKMETKKIGDGTKICGSIRSNDPIKHRFYSKLYNTNVTFSWEGAVFNDVVEYSF